jgi:hypothetical protein
MLTAGLIYSSTALIKRYEDVSFAQSPFISYTACPISTKCDTVGLTECWKAI